MKFSDCILLPFRALWILAPLLGSYARYWLDRRFRREWDLECALEDEGEDGPTVRAILAEGD
ncbi:MAG: hypothetical protein IKH04_10795 [Kiritimatiellae bacterium]|nr:hypothetical protein [Kiritimatiellia bacterium]